MSELSKIRKNGVDYDLKDTVAREAAEGAVKTVNGVAPDENGNVEVDTTGTTEDWTFTLIDGSTVTKRVKVIF